jgi:hypothetical protein
MQVLFPSLFALSLSLTANAQTPAAKPTQPTPATLKTQLAKAKDVRLLVPFQKGSKWGFCDTNKVVIVPAGFQKADFFKGNSAEVQMENETYSLGKDGSLTPSTANPNSTEEIAYGRAAGATKALKNVKGFDLDASGKRINNYAKDSYKELFLLPFSKETYKESRAKAYNAQGKGGIINEKGEVRIPFQYDYIEAAVAKNKIQYYVVRNDSKFGLLKADGKPAMPLTYQKINTATSTPFILYQTADKWGAWNYGLKPVLKAEYSNLEQGFGSKTNLQDDNSFLPYLRAQKGTQMFFISASGKMYNF